MRLRQVAGLSARPRAGAELALPNSLYGVQITLSGLVVGMGRVVGDGGLNFEIVDVAVDPEHQGKGLGRQIMSHIMAYLERAAPQGAYITLMADVPSLYEKFGFKLSRPASEGMYLVK
ncbi:GNAT family N-acetyltransferase [Serratia marcescens]|uniref:GNAT family N-acetyltransferase n=1 Tax=Serratia marcescens TaxID=615 RepID=UPI001C3A2A61|nr:GNAT family N-acetyltransferase [Serratia marcescens]HBH6914488.1 GNAT family N-acetyltransferase [Serratia marcescens]